MTAPVVRCLKDAARRPALTTPQAAIFLRLVAQLLEYDDADTIANMIDYGTFRLECLAARDLGPS